MLTLIYGPPGSGKTYYCDTLILKALSNGKQAVLLVPEQEAVDTENRIYDRAMSEGISLEKLTVVSFRRLANLAFRKHGGIAYSSIGNGGKLLLLWRIIEELHDALDIYKNNRDRSLIELMLGVCSEFKRYCVTPNDLSNALVKLKEGRFKSKLHEVTLIYSAYCARTAEKDTDSSDDINRLAEIYRTNPLDTDECFFVDSFNGFTTPELRVLKYLIKSCQVTVTVNKPSENGRIGFQTVEKTEKQLLEIADNAEIAPPIVLNNESGYAAPEFELIKNKLYDFSYSSDEEYSSDRITFAVCKDKFSEAEFIAARVMKLVREGARYRDIAIISRGIEKYEGVLDAVFEKHSIPLFLSSRFKLTSTPLYKTLNAALTVISDGFETDDIMTLMKCGLLDINPCEADAIEGYVTLWNINGRRWYDETEWFMNPSGFTDEKNEDTEEKLALINQTRKKIIDPLISLKENLKNSTGTDAAKALYLYVKESGIYSYFSNSKDPQDVTVFNTFTELLDTLSKIVGDIPMNAHVLSSLLYLMAKNTDYGAIPSTLDRVTAGDASMVRCNGIKHVFLTDCENGSFPAAVTDDSFFSDSEKSVLEDYDISLSPDITEKNDLESFYFLRSASGATETLTATVCENGGKTYPSVGLQRLYALFPKNVKLTYPSDVLSADMITDAESAKELIASFVGTPLYDVAKKAMDELNIPYNVTDTPIAEPNVTVSDETTDLLFGQKIGMSSTKLEAYVKCPFGYYCSNVLNIRENKQNFFEASDKGIYIHRILEKAMTLLYDNKDASKKAEAEKKKETIADTMIENAVDTSLNEVLGGILGSSKSSAGKRFEAMILRLRTLILTLTHNVVSEFNNSDFVPKFFEFKINKNGLPPLVIGKELGLNIQVNGTVDRVDTFKNGKDVYVRVVDYKTGSREHSIDNIKYGLDTQMLLYLFTLLNSTNEEFRKSLGLEEGGNVLPAGVLYQPAKFSPPRAVMPDGKPNETIKASLKRSGVLISDPMLLEAMDHGITGDFLPIKKTDDGFKTTVKLTLTDEHGLKDIENQVMDALIETGKKMKDGNACARPLAFADPCKYCIHYPICRSRQKN